MTLKGDGGMPARAIAERLGLSMNAVRHHLRALEVAGLVGYTREHRGVGAPAFVYHLTPAGEALFPRRYEAALARLLDHVVAREGREVAVEVLESRYHELAGRLRTVLAGASAEERVHAVTRVLADEGYMPEVRAGTEPGVRLVEHNCPIHQVALRFPEVCEAEARFLADVLEAEVTRDTHIASGCGTCEYQIQARPATSD